MNLAEFVVRVFLCRENVKRGERTENVKREERT